MFEVPELYRVTKGPMGTTSEKGNNGCFLFQFPGGHLQIIASDGMGWEHVSVTKFLELREDDAGVSRINVTPDWSDMCLIKDMFWGDEDLVVQLHPPKAEYVNVHKHVLHLWRKEKTNEYVIKPEIVMV